MIKAIIFDCFGVLVTESWINYKSMTFGHDPELMQQASDLSTQSNAGLISYDQFERSIAEMAGISVIELRKEIDNNPVNEQLFAYIRELKGQGYKIGMLSNAAADWLKDLFYEDHLSLFDSIVLSYEAGVIKPDPRAYELIAERLGVEPAECVFTDDQERFCVAAEEAGMSSFVYRDAAQARADLSALLANSKS